MIMERKLRTIKEILASGEQIDEYQILCKDGQYIKGFLVQERIDKSKDTEGYYIYDMRSGETEDGIELLYATLEPNVCVNWADSIATKTKVDFGEKGYLEIDNEDIIGWEREKIANGEYEDDD